MFHAALPPPSPLLIRHATLPIRHYAMPLIRYGFHMLRCHYAIYMAIAIATPADADAMLMLP